MGGVSFLAAGKIRSKICFRGVAFPVKAADLFFDYEIRNTRYVFSLLFFNLQSSIVDHQSACAIRNTHDAMRIISMVSLNF